MNLSYPTYTVAQLRAAEQAALAATPPGALMARAARAVAIAAANMVPRPLPGRRAVLLVGSGNNGGDALFAGRDLRRRGIAVTAITADLQRAHTAGSAALRRARGRLIAASDPQSIRAIGRADVIIDGLVGLGARPGLPTVFTELIAAANGSSAQRLAIDIPSGIDPHTGVASHIFFRAHRTVTFGGWATGLLLSSHTGRLRLAAIGMDPAQWAPQAGKDTQVLTDAGAWAALPTLATNDHKFSTGPVGIVAGSASYPGAAVLSVGAAVRLRPGLVRYVGPCADAVLQRYPEVVAHPDWNTAGKAAAWALGPGLGTAPPAAQAAEQVLQAPVPVVIDADGINILVAHPQLLPARTQRGLPTVLTPHAGEFARLFPDIPLVDRLSAVRQAAQQTGAVVLLKGHRTVIAAPDGAAFITTTGTPWLATAGSGDVLTGMVASLLAGGAAPLYGAAAAAHLHGLAGQRAQQAHRAGANELITHLLLPEN